MINSYTYNYYSFRDIQKKRVRARVYFYRVNIHKIEFNMLEGKPYTCRFINIIKMTFNIGLR